LLKHALLSPVHTGDYNRRSRRQISPNSATFAVFGDSRHFRLQSPNSATSHQCGQGFVKSLARYKDGLDRLVAWFQQGKPVSWTMQWADPLKFWALIGQNRNYNDSSLLNVLKSKKVAIWHNQLQVLFCHLSEMFSNNKMKILNILFPST